ncbi:MAG: cyclic pyranopterin monophosphate synthase MoaC [Chloroflexota bacterium]|nr:cyclic pyranopterin monophosphate synthase MoaC [Chloroflexota bacterium]
MSNPSQPSPGKKLSHVDSSGKAQMVDVGPKAETERMAVVTGSVLMQPDTLKLIEANDIEKGDVLGVARIAGIMAAKNTAQLIPLCHPLPLDQVTVEFRLDHERSSVDIRGTARTTAKTGVEMEAMTAVSVAALTIYDMCKAVDRGMRIGDIRLRRKSGGKSGDITLE